MLFNHYLTFSEYKIIGWIATILGCLALVLELVTIIVKGPKKKKDDEKDDKKVKNKVKETKTSQKEIDNLNDDLDKNNTSKEALIN